MTSPLKNFTSSRVINKRGRKPSKKSAPSPTPRAKRLEQVESEKKKLIRQEQIAEQAKLDVEEKRLRDIKESNELRAAKKKARTVRTNGDIFQHERYAPLYRVSVRSVPTEEAWNAFVD